MVKCCPFCGELPDTYIHGITQRYYGRINNMIYPATPIAKVKITCNRCGITFEREAEMDMPDGLSFSFASLFQAVSEVEDAWNNRLGEHE